MTRIHFCLFVFAAFFLASENIFASTGEADNVTSDETEEGFRVQQEPGSNVNFISERRTEVVAPTDEVIRTEPPQDSQRKYLRPCYFTNWAQYRQGRGKFLPEDYVPGLCTHILFAFGWMNEDFTVRAYDPADLDTSWARGMYSRVNDLKKTDPELKTLLSIGGWTFGTRLFKAMSKTAQGRKTFIESAIAFSRLHNFDGIDIDWEYPQGDEDMENYSKFIKELREACDAEVAGSFRARLLVTAAVSAGEGTINKAYDIPEIAKYFDFVLLMSYDFHGAWEKFTGMNAPLYAKKNPTQMEINWNVNGAANIWAERGMPKEKIIIGMATYGRGWTLVDPKVNGLGAPGTKAKATKYVREGGVGSYYEFCEMLDSEAIRVWNAQQQVPYLIYGDQWFGYDDEQSYRAKLKWLKENGFGGAFVWTLDFDDFNGQCPNSGGKKYPLISIIVEELTGQVEPIITTPAPPVSTTTPATSSECFGKPSGFHPDPGNCRDFVQCLNDQKYSLSCPANLHFSPSLGYCVQPVNSDCDTSTTTTSTSTTTTSASTTPSTITSTTATTTSSSSTTGFTTATSPTSATTKSSDFKCTTDGFHADPESCGHFYRCVNGLAYRFGCPNNLCFDSRTKVCQHKYNCDCKPTA